MSLRESIIEYAKRYPHQFLNGGEFERLALDMGKKSSNASRRCRELENEGILESRLNEKRCVEYKYRRVMEQVKLGEGPAQASMFPVIHR